ncbi:MAG: hypothetical protein AAGD09_03160 [Cyanobacteria bacterium P01_F01_bin.56]
MPDPTTLGDVAAFMSRQYMQARMAQLEGQRDYLAEDVYQACNFYMLIGPVIRSKLPEYANDPRINMEICMDAMEKYGERLIELLSGNRHDHPH